MTALDDVRAHLAKAREFLDAAEGTHDLGLYNARARRKVVMPGQAVFWLAGGRPKKA